MKKEEKSLEESFSKLEEVIRKLEIEDLGLEESFQLYQEGIKLLKGCNDAIDRVEKKIIILNEKTEQKEVLENEF